jgi:RNA polymerase sigma-70 factor (ECF subfamily)
LSHESDQELVAGLKEGRKETQLEFFNRYYNAILQYLRYLYHGQAKICNDAEDIAINTFCRAYRDINKFEGRSSLKTWLFRIAHNAAIDFYRSSKNKGSLVSLEENTEISESATCSLAGQKIRDPASEAVEKEKQEKIQECLEQLSRDHRIVITLRLIDNCSIKETAQIMGKNEGAIKMLFLRATGRLSKIIKEQSYFVDYRAKDKEGGDLQ